MKKLSLLIIAMLLLLSVCVFAAADGGPGKRRIGRPCGRYTIYRRKKIHNRVGRPCGHRKPVRR